MIFIGLGSNLGDREAQLQMATSLLQSSGIEVVKRSPVYQSPPWGVTDQPHFLNAVVEARSALSPMQTLFTLLEVEKAMGRERKEKWAARTIDLDLLAYENVVLHTPELDLPHPFLHQRAFVLKPWNDIAPHFQVPRWFKTVGELYLDLPANEVDEIRLFHTS